MSSQQYRHQIIRLNGTTAAVSKYQLQISEVSQQGHLVQHARWHFQTFRGLSSFLERNFPNSYPLNREDDCFIQFRVVPAD
jgi:hypothetical protein